MVVTEVSVFSLVFLKQIVCCDGDSTAAPENSGGQSGRLVNVATIRILPFPSAAICQACVRDYTPLWQINNLQFPIIRVVLVCRCVCVYCSLARCKNVFQNVPTATKREPHTAERRVPCQP